MAIPNYKDFPKCPDCGVQMNPDPYNYQIKKGEERFFCRNLSYNPNMPNHKKIWTRNELDSKRRFS